MTTFGDDLVSDGLISDGLISDDLISDDLISDDLISDGLIRDSLHDHVTSAAGRLNHMSDDDICDVHIDVTLVMTTLVMTSSP